MKRCARSLRRQAQLNPRITAGDFDELISAKLDEPVFTTWLSVVLSRFSSGLFRAMFAMKEIENGKEIHRRVSA